MRAKCDRCDNVTAYNERLIEERDNLKAELEKHKNYDLTLAVLAHDMNMTEELEQAKANENHMRWRDDVREKEMELLIGELRMAKAEVERFKRLVSETSYNPETTYNEIDRLKLLADKQNELATKLMSALESARGWVSTHAMQTYSRVADKEVGEIDMLLEEARAALDGESK